MIGAGQGLRSAHKPGAGRLEKDRWDSEEREHNCSGTHTLDPRSLIMVRHIAALLTLFFDIYILMGPLRLFLTNSSFRPAQLMPEDGKWRVYQCIPVFSYSLRPHQHS